MEERIFAAFDTSEDDTHVDQRYKIVRFKQCLSRYHSIVHTLVEHELPTEISHYTLDLSREQSTNPELKPVPLYSGNTIHLWRTGWTLYHVPSSTWIPVLDTNCLLQLPGEFIYTARNDTSQQCIGRIRESKALRYKMFHQLCSPRTGAQTTRIAPLPTPALPAARAVQLPCTKPTIPEFVIASMKRDAIARKESCPISMETFTEDTEVAMTSCFHLFEAASLATWFRKQSTCPMCKAEQAGLT